MEESKLRKIYSKEDRSIALKVYEGHFATPSSHISHYFDLTTMKARAKEAKTVASILCSRYSMNTIVDTIVCLDGMEIVGAFLADELTKGGIMSMNAHQTIYVITPEVSSLGQFIFRDNNRMMIEKKHVLILMASITSGETMTACAESVNYYGGAVSGIAAIFTNISKLAGCDICSIFTQQDVPDYKSYKPGRCDLCAKGVKIDGLINGYGFSKI
ncbi:MAG TPA: phosphoribosyltransferase [Lachnospiraceae bacterium]|jgi:orotate phosphoribosyltransferase|nr:phosphoribosyltransferase [Lachnospiraceae bacterium]